MYVVQTALKHISFKGVLSRSRLSSRNMENGRILCGRRGR